MSRLSRFLPLSLLAPLALIASCAPFAPAPTPTPLPTARPTLAPTVTRTAMPTLAPIVTRTRTSTLAPTGTRAISSSPAGAGAVELARFREMARTTGCADIHNRLFVIDAQLVFWDIAGNCSDASYSQMLFDRSPDQMLCVSHDSIRGPTTNCKDARYKDVFDTITANLSRPDLGLGPQRRVESVPF